MTTRRKSGAYRRLAAGLLGVLACMTVSLSPASSQTVEEIKSRGKLVVGILAGAPPWGYIDSDGKNQGLDADVAALLAKDLGVELEFVPATVASRNALLTSGKVDVLVATVAMWPDRAKILQYTKPYAADKFVVVAAKSTDIKGAEDLAKYTVGVARASSQEKQLVAVSPPSTNLRRLDDDAAVIQALLSGQIDALGGNQFYILQLEKGAPGKFEVKFDLPQKTWMGIASRLGEKEWNAYLNGFVDKIRSNGQLAEIYQRRFGFAMPEFPLAVEGIPFTVP